MADLTKNIEAHKSASDPPGKATRLFAYPPQTGLQVAQTEEQVVQTDYTGVVLGSRIENVEDFYAPPLPPVLEHPAPHRGYLIASRVLSGVAGLLSIGTIVTAGIGVDGATHYYSYLTSWFISVFLGLSIAEAGCCFVAMLACFCLLMKRPYKVLIRSPQNGSFICLCFSVFLLFLFAVYSAVMQILCEAWEPDYVPPAALCVIPCVRAAVLLSFFSILLANSQLLPHDPLF